MPIGSGKDLIGQQDIPRRWTFDHNAAVEKLLSESIEESYAFERAINLYLLFIWALWPAIDINGKHSGDSSSDCESNRIQIRNTARTLGSVITFTKINGKSKTPRARPLTEIRELIAQVGRPWFQDFDREFLAQLGGLRAQVLNARHAKSRAREIQSAWSNTLLLRDVVQYLCKMQLYNYERASGKGAVYAIQQDVFERGEYRDRMPKRPRKGKDKVEVIARKTVEQAWQEGSKGAVLLYAFQVKFPQVAELNIASRAFLKELHIIAGNRDSVREFLLYYKFVQEVLRPVGKLMKSVAQWDVIDFSYEVPKNLYARLEQEEVFTAEQAAKLGIARK